jgi:hypothetical protein
VRSGSERRIENHRSKAAQFAVDRSCCLIKIDPAHRHNLAFELVIGTAVKQGAKITTGNKTSAKLQSKYDLNRFDRFKVKTS